MVRNEVTRLRSFGQYVEFQAARSGEILKAIDDVIYACCAERDQLIALTGAALEFVQALKRAESPIDQDGSILKKLEQARDSLARAYDEQAKMRESAANAPSLHEDDGVVEAFDGLLDAIAAAHNAMNDLCWAVGEHEADFDKVASGTYKSADDLLAALKG
ncbi:hypothetical protein LMG28688_04210 [Paraburkholderia caffeinitolerans]|uniref:Uncharacterized protein n=1 Tax=Paraburkholderia caffeinitolerans TaxID=1723730 RepID=A0A6J5GCC4_9BURK|nr:MULTISPECIES: hypothetical protein [Paraburkholderia]CAB3795982.1 hypothetical protein LMG28688_04210 [Paraburkholderia caffeinitolerans]